MGTNLCNDTWRMTIELCVYISAVPTVQYTDRNDNGKFRHICRMSQDQIIRVTEEFSDIYDANLHQQYRSFPMISEFSDKITLLILEFYNNVGVYRQIYVTNIGVF